MTQYREATLDKQDSAEVKNYTRVPNMLIFGYLDNVSPQEKWLYVCFKHMCGKKGTRHLSLRYISEQTGISTGALSKSKHSDGMIRHLHDAGLIHAEIKRHEGKGNPQYHITITDIWALNQTFFAKSCPKSEQDDDLDAEPGRISDEPVHNSDKLVQISDEPVRNSANTNTTYKTNYNTTEQDESMGANALAPVDITVWKVASDKLKAVTLPIASDYQSEEDITDAPTEKMPITKPEQPIPTEGLPAPAAPTELPPRVQQGAMAMTPRQIKAQAERREKELWVIIESERNTKYTTRQREMYENKEGMKCLIADDISDEELREGLKALSDFERKTFTVLKFYGWLPNLSAKEPIPKTNGKTAQPFVIDQERNQRNIEAMKARNAEKRRLAASG